MQGIKGIAEDLYRWIIRWKITCGLQASIRVSRVYGLGHRNVEINPHPPNQDSPQRRTRPYSYESSRIPKPRPKPETLNP